MHKIDDIASLLRLQEEFGIGVTVEHACDVNDGHIYALLKERGIPVVFGPLDAFAYKVELRHENWRNVRHLLESGVEFGLMTDHPVVPQRNLLLALRWFLRCGLNRQDAIEIVTPQERADPRRGRLPRDPATRGNGRRSPAGTGTRSTSPAIRSRSSGKAQTLFEEG